MQLKLKIARLQQNPPLTAWRLAQMAGISAQRMSLIETGRAKPSRELKRRISTILKKTIEELFDDENTIRGKANHQG